MSIVQIKNDTVLLQAETFGSKAGTPLLLISGAMAPAFFWPHDFCESLASKDYLVVRFDNRININN